MGAPTLQRRQLAPLLEALKDRGFVGGYEELGKSFERRVSRAAIGRGVPDDYAAQVDAGHRAWISGKFEEAVKLLTPLVELAHSNSGAFATAKHQDTRDAVSKAMIALALSYQRLNNNEATQQVFAELIRSFPKLSLSRATHGADAVATFDAIRKKLTDGPRGKLIVRSNVDSALIFINEEAQPAGPVNKELLPGEYRVFAQIPGKQLQLSRAHRVTVKASETTTTAIDLAFDAAVQTSATWTGLGYTSAGEREKSEILHAARFGKSVSASDVAVVGIDQIRGKPAIVGIVVDHERGTELRRASVALDPEPSTDRLKALAQFLAGENLMPDGIDVIVSAGRRAGGGGGNGGSQGPVDKAPSSGTWGGWKWMTGGLALATLGVGGYLLSLDGGCQTPPPAGTPCTDLYVTSTPAYLTLGGGVALAGVAIYLFVRGAGSKPSQSASYVLPARGGAMAGWAIRF